MIIKFNCQVTVEKKQTTVDSTYGTEIVTWVPLVALAGSPVVAEKFPAEIQDALPSRSEAVQQGLGIARAQSRLRLHWRDDMDSAMRVTVHKDSDVVYQIVSGIADIGGRKEAIEMMLEKYSS